MINGMTRPVDGLGRIVLPSEIRKNMGVHKDSEFEVTVTGENTISLKLVTPLSVKEAMFNLKTAIVENNQQENMMYRDILTKLEEFEEM